MNDGYVGIFAGPKTGINLLDYPLKKGNSMLLLALIIFLISLIFLTKASVLNKWVTCFVLNLLNELIQTKGDISSPDGSVIHAGGELTIEGNNITLMGANGHTVHHSIDLSQFINHKQSSHSNLS